MSQKMSISKKGKQLNNRHFLGHLVYEKYNSFQFINYKLITLLYSNIANKHNKVLLIFYYCIDITKYIHIKIKTKIISWKIHIHTAFILGQRVNGL